MPPPPALKKKSGTKNPPILSQEYLIQNHGKYFSKTVNLVDAFKKRRVILFLKLISLFR
jgi:hypothetical protein